MFSKLEEQEEDKEELIAIFSSTMMTILLKEIT